MKLYIALSFILFLTLIYNGVIAQTPDTTHHATRYRGMEEKDLSLLAGGSYWHYGYGELGLAINKYGTVGPEPIASAYFISNEIKIDKHMLMGPKIGGWIAGGASAMALGINMIDYTDFNSSSLRIRPEIGIGVENFKIVYGYNIAIAHKNFEGVNRSNVSLVILFRLKKLKDKPKRR